MSEIKALEDTTGGNKRRRIMLIIAAIFICLGGALLLNWFLYSRFYEETDNAYVQGNIVQITPQIVGTVAKIYVDDTDFVKAGQTLISLDPADTKVAVEQAEAELAQTVREVRTLYTSHKQSDANLAQRQVELTRAEDDVVQRRKLALTGTISKEELRHAEATYDAARAAVDAARDQLSSGSALIDGISVRKHPNVLRAAAHLRELLLAMQRTSLLAPVNGQVAKRTVQVGQRVSPGTPLMAVIPLDQLWVDANFKEAQLRKMRVGQPVTLISDLYGSSVKYTGKVVGMGAGTGGAFALLPAQNATGNWIKVVQRVPVRISLDSTQLANRPLRIGLSMQVEVDIHEQNGNPLGSTKELTTYSFETPADNFARSRIESIIEANLK